MRKLLLTLLVASTGILFAANQDSDYKKVHYHTGHSTPMLMVLKDQINISEAEAKAYLAQKLQLAQGEDLVEISRTTDFLGFTHIKYQQYNNGIEVYGAQFQAHMKNGRVAHYTGHYFPNIAKKQATISASQSIQYALDYFNAQQYMWEVPAEEAILKDAKSDPNATHYPSPKLMYFNITDLKNPEYKLGYLMDVYARTPLKKESVFVSAEDGKILTTINQLHDISTPATAISRFSDTVRIITEQVGVDSFRLEDLTRGGGVRTYNMFFGTNRQAAEVFTHDDTLWDIVNANMDEVAIDAHWGAEMTYDYFFLEHSRNSYDDGGAPLLSYVHYDQNYSNAFWDGTRMTYGDGSVGGNPFISIDIVGHELAHGVTGNSSNLVYQGEPGGLNESFSDIWGNTIEHYVNPGRATWYVGEQSFNAMRNMSDPGEFGDPDTYQGNGWASTAQGAFDNGGVHTNSGVQNFWYYLLVEGGTGVNDNGDPYNVTAMGWDAAGDIAYRNSNVYLGVFSDYEDAGVFGVQAADDFYGMCSPESKNVNEAWYAVGVLRRMDASIDVDFTMNKSYTCVMPQEMIFNNFTVGGTSNVWDFGDGGISTSTNAIHAYQTPGTYTVTLTGYMDNGCYTDTGVVVQTVNVIALGSPDTANCTPDVNFRLSSVGVDRVRLHYLDYQSGLADGEYNDYTCEANAIMHIDSTYELIVNTSPSTKENVRVWVDFNRDGDFDDASEMIFSNDETYATHSGNITFNTFSGVTLNKPLRMRVASDVFFNKAFHACDDAVNGQYEDYSILILNDWNVALDLEEGLSSSFQAYPNPAKDVINISVGNEVIKDIQMIDILGNQVMKSTTRTLDVSTLASGTYFVKVFTNTDSYTEKIIIE